MQMYKYRQQAAVRATLLCQTWQIKKSSILIFQLLSDYMRHDHASNISVFGLILETNGTSKLIHSKLENYVLHSLTLNTTGRHRLNPLFLL